MAAYRWVDDLLTVTCRLTACTPGSSPGPTLGIEYGKPLSLPFYPRLHCLRCLLLLVGPLKCSTVTDTQITVEASHIYNAVETSKIKPSFADKQTRLSTRLGHTKDDGTARASTGSI